jgi:hypothetical protein
LVLSLRFLCFSGFHLFLGSSLCLGSLGWRFLPKKIKSCSREDVETPEKFKLQNTRFSNFKVLPLLRISDGFFLWTLVPGFVASGFGAFFFFIWLPGFALGLSWI